MRDKPTTLYLEGAKTRLRTSVQFPQDIIPSMWRQVLIAKSAFDLEHGCLLRPNKRDPGIHDRVAGLLCHINRLHLHAIACNLTIECERI